VPYVIIYIPFSHFTLQFGVVVDILQNWLREPEFIMKTTEELCKDVRAHKN